MLGRRARQSRASSRSRFDALLHRVELAKAELVAAVPSPRGVPGRPLAAALLAFEEGLREAAADLDRWPRPDAPVADCREAVDESLRRAERLRLQAPDLDHEGLLAQIAELLAPLDAFGAMDRRGRWL